MLRFFIMLVLACTVTMLDSSLASAQVTFTGPTSYTAGAQVSITAVLNTSDPNENGEGEPLTIQSTTGFTATNPNYAIPQGYFFIAPAAGTLSAFISGADGDETGAVTVSVAPSNCSTSAPTPVPTPIGCPVKPLSQAQKDMLALVALRTTLIATGVYTGAFFCGAATAGACAIPLGVMGGILTIGAAYSGYVAAVDPTDPNFMVIAQPVIPTFTPLTAQNGVTQAEADSFNALMSNLAQELGYFRVLITSSNRAQGAADAGNALWETAQIQAALNYAATIGSLFGAQPALLSNFQNALSNAGFNLTLTPSMVLQAEQSLAFNGLPSSIVQGLTQFGFTTAEIDQIRKILMVQNINTVAGSFPSILTNSQLITTLQQASKAFVTPVQIVIKPPISALPVPINASSKGVIPVAILSTPTFNAATNINPSSLTFGRTGDEQSLAFCHSEDVNNDGLPDLICQFKTSLAGFRSGDTVGILKGRTVQGGVSIFGQSAVVILP